MGLAVSLKKMSIEEKLQTMEALWDDLNKTVYNISSPAWHEKVLNEREHSVKNGMANFTEWESAKKRISGLPVV
jgi:hypothetical protein